jgi:diacylglycerol kinase family enzyme
MRTDVIVNITARLYRRRSSLIERVRHTAAEAVRDAPGGPPTVVTVHPTASVAELGIVARALSTRGTDLVVLSGGDGSFMAGVTALAKEFGEDKIPRIALIPGGTVATVARNWGTRGDPLEALQGILRKRDSLTSMRRPTLRVRDDRSPEDRIGFMFGTGLVANFFDVYYADGARGYPGAARIVARVFAESFFAGAYARRILDPIACSIEVDGSTLEPKAWSLVCASVVRDLGIHMVVNYRAGEDLQRPHLVASALSSRELGPRAPRVLAGRPIGGRAHFDDLVGRFVVRFPEEGPYVLDGDTLRAREVSVSAGPPIDVVVTP